MVTKSRFGRSDEDVFELIKQEGENANSTPPSQEAGMITAMRLITRADFEVMERQDPYFRGRWAYYSEIIEIVEAFDRLPESCLEIGAYRLPVSPDSDTLDITRWLPNLTYHHDAGKTPWPIDRGYDLAIALQVWEHLGGSQEEAFGELRRVASRAIMSFPLEWNKPDDRVHHGITEGTISRWVHGLTPTYRRVSGKQRHRLIYVLDFE
jgi:hypothetical protein